MYDLSNNLDTKMYYFSLGVGFVKILASVLLASYYPIIMALSLFYGTRSLTGNVPFPECSNSINFFVSIYFITIIIRACVYFFNRNYIRIIQTVRSRVLPVSAIWNNHGGPRGYWPYSVYTMFIMHMETILSRCYPRI